MLPETARTWAEVDTQALLHNLEVARQHTDRKLMCVIKGDAHGHGAAECGKALEKAGVDAFAVACLEEGIALRSSGITRPILVLGWTDPALAPSLSAHSLAQSVFDEGYAQALSAAGVPLDIHIKLDTGMSRTGIFAQQDPEAAADTVLRIYNLPNLSTRGIFSHCAVADVPAQDGFTAFQVANFQKVLDILDRRGFPRDITRHMGNSAVTLYHPEAHFDMVRLGVMLYGFYPDGIHRADGPLQPVLTLKSRIAQVKALPAGAAISYGCTYHTDAPTKIAVVACGYADSYPRALSNKGAWAIIRGQKCPQIGRICMDMCMFDVTGVDAQAGDEVILYGAGAMTLDEIAALTGSINCEVSCLLTQRVKKVYL